MAPTPDLVASEPSVERYREKIQRHIQGLVPDRSEAEDLTQETLLRAHKQLATLRDHRALGVWLYRIATHVCYDYLRSARSLPVRNDGDGDEELDRAEERIPGDGPTLDQLVDHAAMSACGERLLDTLPDAYRAVLLLHDLQGLSSVEIARLLRCMPGSVKVRLHRARCRFRAALEKECHFYRDERGVLLGCPKSHTGERAT